MAKGVKNRRPKIQNVHPRKSAKKNNYIGSKDFKSAGWDKTLSLYDNMEIVGLQADPNSDLRRSKKSRKTEMRVQQNRVYNLGEKWHSEVDTQANIYGEGQRQERRPNFFLPEGNIREISRLIEKYGDDVDKMEMDHKLNPFLRSKGWLKNRIQKYKEHLAYQEKQDNKSKKEEIVVEEEESGSESE